MYQNKFVAAIKVNGQILRETNNGSVAIPFGAEYALFLKNLNSVRVKVRVSLDGTDATDGSALVLTPNSSLDLERFIKSGNFNTGNRFKFIERTKKIEQHRGARGDDGIVRIEYFTEHVRPVVDVPEYHYYPVPRPVPRPYPAPWPYPRPRRWSDNLPSRSMTPRASCSASLGASGGTRSRSSVVPTSVPFANDIGITVAGSQSHQQFYAAQDFHTVPQSDVIVLRLCGTVGEAVVKRPITVKTKQQCVTCGQSSKSGVEFCSRCGTALAVA